MGKDKSRLYFEIDYWEREAIYRIISRVTCAPIEGLPFIKGRGDHVTWEATARFGDKFIQFEGRTPMSAVKRLAKELEG